MINKAKLVGIGMCILFTVIYFVAYVLYDVDKYLIIANIYLVGGIILNALRDDQN